VSQLNLILLGPPGAGKGTQAEGITQHFKLPYFATGNMLRDAVARDTELGRKAKEYMDRGDLVPDDIIVGLALEAIESPEAADGFLLDGFPRTVAQADALAEALQDEGRSLTGVLYIDVPDEDLVRRLAGRRTCAEAGHPYHLETNPPKRERVCDIDGSPLVQRDDDNEETVRNRLAVFHSQTAPLIDYYDERGLLRRFDGTLSPSEVHDHIRAAVSTLRLEDEL
jgi:adenylate kinase